MSEVGASFECRIGDWTMQAGWLVGNVPPPSWGVARFSRYVPLSELNWARHKFAPLEFCQVNFEINVRNQQNSPVIIQGRGANLRRAQLYADRARVPFWLN